jgi:lysozyme
MSIRTFSPAAGVASAQGLDVSNFQGNYNWAAAVKAFPGLAFGIHRLTQGLGAPGTNSPDPTARWNHAQIRDNGLRRGAYHFLDPFADGAQQARYFAAMHEQLGLVKSDMLWLDNETAGNSAQAVAACAHAFMTELHSLRPDNPMGVYTFIDFAKEGNCQGLSGWPLWLAYPNASAPAPPPPWVKWTFWQWGTRTGVDADAFNGTVADLDAWIASFAPSPPGPFKHVTDGKTSLTAIAQSRGMHAGSWLAEQQMTAGKEAADALGNAVPAAGLPWYSNTP